MFVTDVIRRSGRSLKSAKVRTILTALAIAVGGFTLSATLAAGNGIRDYTNRLVSSNFDPAELLVGRDKEISNTGTPDTKPKEYDESIASMNVDGNGGSLQLKQVTESDLNELRALPYVEQVRENYQLTTRYITREGQKNYTLSGQAYNPAQKPEIKAGEVPSSSDLADGEVALPENYLSVLGFKDANDAIGKKVTINVQEPYGTGSAEEILGLLQQGGNLESLKPKEQNLVYTVALVTKKPATSISFGALPVLFSHNDAKAIYDYTTNGTPSHGKYLYVYARIKDGTNESKIKAAQDDLKAKNYFTESSKEIQQQITQIVNILQIMVGVFGVITVIASVFGIVNTQYISVLERTREIGLMKALGMRSRDVRRLFMLEAGWIGFLGGVIGSVAAITVGTSLNPWIKKKIDLGNNLLIFRPAQIITLIVGLMIVAMIAGFLPARKAAKLDPIEALRTE